MKKRKIRKKIQVMAKINKKDFPSKNKSDQKRLF